MYVDEFSRLCNDMMPMKIRIVPQDEGNGEFLSVYGNTDVIYDQAKCSLAPLENLTLIGENGENLIVFHLVRNVTEIDIDEYEIVCGLWKTDEYNEVYKMFTRTDKNKT